MFGAVAGQDSYVKANAAAGNVSSHHFTFVMPAVHIKNSLYNHTGTLRLLLRTEAEELTQLDSVRLVSLSSALLDQGGKGHR